MGGLLLPACSVFFSLLLCFAYLLKKRFPLIENKVYSVMLIISVFDSIIVTILQYIAYKYGVTNMQMIIRILNKIDFSLLIFFLNGIFLYILFITHNYPKDKSYKILNTFIGINSILTIIIFFLDVNVINTNNNFSVDGSAANLTYLVCGIYIFSAIVVALKNIKKADRRYIPILGIAILSIILMLLYIIDPYLIIISISLTFFDYLMYFTIENPDVKMIEKLNILKNQADKANMAKSEFLSSMSHEIRTPLNAIVGFSESLKEESLSKEAMEEVDDIISASSTLLEIVNGILDISKIEANKIEIVDNEYDISKVLKELVNLTKVKIGAKPIDLKVNIAKDLPQYLYGDQLRVKQVILNLLTNAAKYTDSGVINFDVTSVIANDSCRLIISVKDTGRGIKKENIDKLFTKFERLDEENSTIEGTGLGLAITKKLVTMMGGKIVVKSEYQKGSDFIVAIDQKIVANPTIKEENEIALNKSLSTYKDKKILLVDDNNMNLKVAKRLLQIYEVQIDTCDNGNDTINKIKNNENYDLILLDDMMPGKSGCETLKELKEIPNFKIPVVVLTANAIEGMKEKYLDAGFDDYLAKPIVKDELKRILTKFLN